MKITFLGTSHGICEKDSYLSSTMISVGGKNYVVDAGAPMMDVLLHYGVPLSTVAGIWISHSHSDHYIGLVELSYQLNAFSEFDGVQIPVFVPDTERYEKIQQFLFGNPDLTHGRVPFQVYESGVVFDDGTLKITAIPVGHIRNAHSFLLEAEGRKVLLTSDLLPNFPDFPKVAFTERLDLVVTEAAHTKLSAPAVREMLSGLKTDRLVVTHRNPAVNPDAETDELLASFSGFTASCGYDGMTVVL